MNNELENSQFNSSSSASEIEDLSEFELANLVGYGDFVGQLQLASATPENEMEAEVIENQQSGNVIEASELLDLDDSPDASKTEPTFSNSPFSKLGLVGLVLFVIFAGGGGFLSTVMSSKPSPPAVAEKPSPAPTPIPEVAPSNDEEVGKLKTSLALAQQEEKLKAVSESSSPKTSAQTVTPPPKTSASSNTAQVKPTTTATTSTSPPPRYSSSPPPVPSTPPAPARVARANPPTPVRSTTPVVARTPSTPTRSATPVVARTPSTPTPVRTATSVAARTQTNPTPSTPASKPSDSSQRIATVPNKTSTQAKPTSSVNPQEEWLALSQLGSYGTNEQVENSTTTAETRIASLDNSPTVANTTTAVVMPRAIPVVSSRSTGGVPFPTPAFYNIAQTNDAVLASNTMSLPTGAIPFPSETTEKGDTATNNTESTSSSSVDEVVARVNPEEEQNILSGTPVELASLASLASEASVDGNSTQPATLVAQEEPSAPQFNVAEEQSFLVGTQSRRLQVGSQAHGQLASPAVWHSDGGTKEQFLVELKQPLLENNGKISLPSGSLLVATVKQVSSTGVATVDVSRLVIDEQEYVLPEGALALKQDSGQPLMASNTGNKGSEIASRDMTAFALGSLAKVGEMMNRPDVETSTSTSGIGVNQTTISRSGNRNILGAVLEGGFNPLATEMLRRNRQATEEAMKSPDTWYIPGGQNVQIVVARSFEF